MSSVTNVGIKLTLDGAQQAEAGLRRVQGGMAALGDTAESVRGAMQQLAGAFAGVVSVRAFVQAADAVTQLQNQLKLATGSTQAATAAYQQLFDIAQRSRVSFTELGGTFASIARASESLGLSQQQLLRLTETIGNAIAVGGQSAAASQAALVQLSQGLASGVLRGEELNSILEQAPRLARALADGLDVSTGALRKMGEEGELTAERVIGALQSQASVLANEVQSSVVTVGQAFTQLQNSATALVGEIDRVSGASSTLAGVAQAASESLDNIARAFRDTQSAGQSAGQQVNVFADAIAVVFETVTVLGVNVAYVIKQIGIEIGGLAAQAAAVARLDFSAAREIGRLMREDAEAARRDVDALSERILNQRRLAEQARQSLQGVDTRAEDARLARYAAQAEGVRKVGAAAADTKKKVKSLGDEFAAQREAARGWADAYQEQQAKALEAAAKAEFERIEALERNAASAEEQLQRLLDEERALVIAAERNITLAQAIEEVAIARLREQQAALMAEGDRDAEVLAIQREIDARKKLAEAIGRKEARDAAAESASEAEREWRRTAENIERSLTDALLRGFESGKDFARNLRDTVVNLFQSLVLRPVVQAVVAPVAGGITGALGLPGVANAATGGPGAFGMASSLKSIYDTVVGGFTALGNSVAFAAQDIGAWLVNNTTGVLNRLGGGLMSNAGMLGTGASYLGGIGAGIGVGRLISGGYAISGSGNGVVNAGTAIGAVFGGPLGAAVGGAIGGFANSLFGRKLKDQGIEGTFDDDGFTGNSYRFYKGGKFRSNKTKRSDLDPKLDQALDQQFMALRMGSLALGDVLGGAATALDGFARSIKISFKGLNEQQIQERLAEELGKIGDAMAQEVLRSAALAEQQAADAYIDQLSKEGETASQTLTRLAGSLQAVNAAFDSLGRTTLEASLKSGDLASKIIEAFGGLDQFGTAVQTYYANFYTEQERLAEAVESMGEAFAGLGLTMPKTKAEFRALVEAQDVTTESGRKTLAALLNLSGAFAEIADASHVAAGEIETLSDTLRSLQQDRRNLERELLALRGGDLRAFDTEGFTEAEIAAYDYNQALRDQIDAIRAAQQAEKDLAAQRQDLERQRLAALGDQAGLRALDLAELDPSNRALQQSIWALEDAKNAASNALAALAASVEVEKERLRNEFESESAVLRDRISAIGDVIATLDNAVRSVRGSVETTSIASQTAARLTLQSVLTAVRGGADITGFESVIEQARATLTRNDPNLYQTREQFVRAQAQSVGLLEELNKAGGKQLTTAELQLQALEDGFAAEMARLDDLVAQAEKEINALLGIDKSVLSVEEAVKAVNTAVKAVNTAIGQLAESVRRLASAALSRKSAAAPYSVSSAAAPYSVSDTPAERQAKVEYQTGVKVGAGDSPLVAAAKVLYQSINGGASTAQYNAAAQAVGGDIAAAVGWDGTREGAERLREIYGFAKGGYYPGGLALVGEEGPELINFENPGQVYTATQTQRLLDNREVVAELKALRSEVIELRAQARRTADAVNGNPEAPMLVEAVV